MKKEKFKTQEAKWPQSGKHILAQFDSSSIVVYQAYNQAIANYAINHQHFGGEFSFSRMSWIKTNFLWMMYRSGWGTKAGQEMILAVTIKIDFFEKLLEQAVSSTPVNKDENSYAAWREKLTDSEVRLQWDPDHDPYGNPKVRKAIQIGLRGSVLREYSKEAIISIQDMTGFVVDQRENVKNDLDSLITPSEGVFVPQSKKAFENIGLEMQ